MAMAMHNMRKSAEVSNRHYVDATALVAGITV